MPTFNFPGSQQYLPFRALASFLWGFWRLQTIGSFMQRVSWQADAVFKGVPNFTCLHTALQCLLIPGLLRTHHRTPLTQFQCLACSLLLSLPSVLIQCCKFTKPVFLANPPGVFLQPHFPSPDSVHFNHRRHLATFSKVHFLQVIQSGIATKPPNLSSLACLTSLTTGCWNKVRNYCNIQNKQSLLSSQSRVRRVLQLKLGLRGGR